jgi:membrane protease YdiL (CAAX protease family)
MSDDPASGLSGGIFHGEQHKATIILVLSPLLVLAWKCFGTPEFYLDQIQPLLLRAYDPPAVAATYCFLSALVLLGVIPALVVKLVFREPLAAYGVRLGNRVRTVRSLLVLAPVMVLAAFLASRLPAIRAAYPIDPGACGSMPAFALHVATYLLFYLGWEFHFRGFLQFGLQARVGTVHAVLIQAMASSLAHLGKPWPESFAAIAAGLLWGGVAYRTQSLLSGLLQHTLLGIALDGFIGFVE